MLASPTRAGALALALNLIPLSALAEDGARAGSPPRYTLRQLVAMARASYPGVDAARHAVTAMERDVYRARWAWLPQGNVRGLVAPAPELACFNADGKTRDSTNCIQTNEASVNSFKIAGVLARIELEVGMPLYTFDKLGSARRAAGAGVEVRKAQLRMSEDKLDLDVAKAYWGLKVAREILFTIREGLKNLTDAEEKIEKELEDGEGDYTVTDLLRLKAARAEVDVRIPEVEKLERLSLAALATLAGQRERPFDVDTSVIDVLDGRPLPLSTYLKVARSSRPEVKLLEAAVKARHAAVDLERARFFPDFLLVAMVGVAYTSSVDDPKNAFYADPFNFLTAGFGLAMTWKWDQFQQYGLFRKAQAEARETEARQKEALSGIELEIKKAHADLEEARQRLAVAQRGEKTARRWLVSVTQNLAAGLAETRDLTDALVAYFQLRLRHLQAIYDVNVGWSELGRTIGTAAGKR
jgi:outer membrane protein TolC